MQRHRELAWTRASANRRHDLTRRLITLSLQRSAALAVAVALAGAVAPAAAHASPTRGEYIVQFAAPVHTAAQRRTVIEHTGGSVTRDVRLINAPGADLTSAEAA